MSHHETYQFKLNDDKPNVAGEVAVTRARSSARSAAGHEHNTHVWAPPGSKTQKTVARLDPHECIK
jgi:hypothetical protein